MPKSSSIHEAEKRFFDPSSALNDQQNHPGSWCSLVHLPSDINYSITRFLAEDTERYLSNEKASIEDLIHTQISGMKAYLDSLDKMLSDESTK
jgi:hypothetical protein